MDQTRFDHLVRALGASRTRRQAMRAALAVVGLGAIAQRDTAAQRPDPRRTICRKHGASCTRTLQCCSGYCETRREIERARRNRCSCPDSQLLCSGVCIAASLANCGGCGDACDTDVADSCHEGECGCGDHGPCANGRPCVDGVCRCTADSQCAGGADGSCQNGVCQSCAPNGGKEWCAVGPTGRQYDACGFVFFPSSDHLGFNCNTDIECAANCEAGKTCFCAIAFGNETGYTDTAHNAGVASVGMGACSLVVMCD